MSERENELFEEWWENEGQYHRAGGDKYCKTFAYHAWESVINREGYKLVPVDDLKHIRALNKDAIEANEKYLKEITSTLGRIVDEMIEGNSE